MKSKLTKIVSGAVSLTLIASSLVVPTMAAGASGTVNVGFGVFSPKMTVTIPTTAALQVNPMFDSTAANLNKYSIASDAIGIENRTSALINGKETGVPLKCKVNATIASVGEGVQTEYASFTPSATSPKKKVALNLQEVTVAYDEDTDKAGAQIYKVTGFPTTAVQTPITKEGSSLSIAIAAPTVTLESGATGAVIAADEGGFGAFAITGDANIDADWQNSDLALEVTYDIKPASTSFTSKGAVTATVDETGADATVITMDAAALNDASVEAVFLHNDEIEDYAFADQEVEFEVEDNIVSGAVDGVKVNIGKDYTEYAGTAIKAVVVLDDGRTAVVNIANAAAAATP